MLNSEEKFSRTQTTPEGSLWTKTTTQRIEGKHSDPAFRTQLASPRFKLQMHHSSREASCEAARPRARERVQASWEQPCGASVRLFAFGHGGTVPVQGRAPSSFPCGASGAATPRHPGTEVWCPRTSAAGIRRVACRNGKF